MVDRKIVALFAIVVAAGTGACGSSSAPSGGAGGREGGAGGGGAGETTGAAGKDAAESSAADASDAADTSGSTDLAGDGDARDAVDASDAADTSGSTDLAGDGDARGGDGGTDSGAGDGSNQIPIPAGYTQTEIGAYALGAPVSATSGVQTIDAPATGCSQVVAIVRDFRGCFETSAHPDFEDYSGGAQTTGLVAPTLGADRKPVYASKCESGSPMCGGFGNGLDPTVCPYGPQTTSKADYDEWYRTTANVNLAYEVNLIFEPNGPGKTTFDSASFFPLDGLPLGSAGFGLSGKDDHGQPHDFGFTTELHTTFVYNGGERLTFTGDHDLWIFVNGHLALDLGGLHPQVTGTIDMDAMASLLGLVKGQAATLELFHAQRHTTSSVFRLDTNFVFGSCGTIIP
jgi:fibro-slime domain-containing protein